MVEGRYTDVYTWADWRNTWGKDTASFFTNDPTGTPKMFAAYTNGVVLNGDYCLSNTSPAYAFGSTYFLNPPDYRMSVTQDFFGVNRSTLGRNPSVGAFEPKA